MGFARFRDVDQWSLGDLKALRRQTDDLEDDTLKLEDESMALKTQIAELQTLLLKGIVDCLRFMAPKDWRTHAIRCSMAQRKPASRRSSGYCELATIRTSPSC
jgi:hypothetical protein